MKTKSKMPTPRRTVNPTMEPNRDLQERIRRRAYELYEQRGKEDGHDLDDWLQAESEVAQGKFKTVAA